MKEIIYEFTESDKWNLYAMLALFDEMWADVLDGHLVIIRWT